MKIRLLIILILLFSFSKVYSRQIIDIQKEKKPYYVYALSLDIGYFNPVGSYKVFLEPTEMFSFLFKYNPKIVDFLVPFFEVSYIGSSVKKSDDEKYKIIPVGMGLEYFLNLYNEKYFFKFKGVGGKYFFDMADETYNGFYFKTGCGISWQATNNISMDILAEYNNFFGSRTNINSFNLIASTTYSFGTPITEKDIKIESFETDGIYTSLYQSYYKKSIGALKIKNTSKKALKNIEISVYIKDIMDNKSKSKHDSTLLPGKTAVIPITALFNENITQISHHTIKTGIIEIDYTKVNGNDYKKRDVIKIEILSKNAMVWDDLKKLGAFISHLHNKIIDFSRKAINISLENEDMLLPPDILNVVKIIQAIKDYKIKYVKDPTTYRNILKTEMDYIQYPIETLQRRTGDCDDLTVLLASLLESVGIRTAFISIPGHIFMMFEVKNFPIENKLVRFGGKKWIPIETTVLNKGFTDAWLIGYENYIANANKEIKTISESIIAYPSVNIKSNIQISLSPENHIKSNILKEINKIKNLFTSTEIVEVDNLKTASALNNKAVNFSKAGIYEKAEKLLKMAIKKNKSYKNAYYNLLRLYHISSKLEKALGIYNQFKKINKKDAYSDFLISKIFYKKGIFDQAKKYYKKAIGLNPEFIDKIYSNKINSRIKTESLYYNKK